MTKTDPAPDPGTLCRVENGSTFEVWRFRATTMRLEWPRAGLVVLTIAGHGHADLAPPCLKRWSEALRTSTRLTLLVDFWDMPGYDSGLRLALTDWCLEHRDQLEAIHLLTRSPMVRMGATVANLALGGLMKIHTLRTSYDLAIKHLDLPSGPSAPSRRR